MSLKQLNSQQTRRKACDGEPKWMDSIVKMNKTLLDEEFHTPVRVSIRSSVSGAYTKRLERMCQSIADCYSLQDTWDFSGWVPTHIIRRLCTDNPQLKWGAAHSEIIFISLRQVYRNQSVKHVHTINRANCHTTKITMAEICQQMCPSYQVQQLLSEVLFGFF